MHTVLAKQIPLEPELLGLEDKHMVRIYVSPYAILCISWLSQEALSLVS